MRTWSWQELITGLGRIPHDRVSLSHDERPRRTDYMQTDMHGKELGGQRGVAQRVQGMECRGLH